MNTKNKEFNSASKELLKWVEEDKSNRSALVISTTEENGKFDSLISAQGKPSQLGRAVHKLMLKSEKFANAIFAAVNLYIEKKKHEME